MVDAGVEHMQVDPDSLAVPSPGPPAEGPVLRVLCHVLLAAVVLTASVWLWAESVPGGHFLIRIGLLLVWLVLGMVWLPLAAGTFHFRHRPARGGVALLVAAALVLATAALTVGHVPLRLRFELSRGAFEQVVQDGELAVAAASPDELRDVFDGARDRALYLDVGGRVGWYDAADAAVDPDGTSLRVMGSWSGYAGFVHAPDGVPAWMADEFRGISTLDLGGGWYTHWSGVD